MRLGAIDHDITLKTYFIEQFIATKSSRYAWYGSQLENISERHSAGDSELLLQISRPWLHPRPGQRRGTLRPRIRRRGRVRAHEGRQGALVHFETEMM